MTKGYVQVYTGNGKGKTTAAIGLAVRAIGSGYKVYFAQFLKGQNTSELSSLIKFKNSITFKQFGNNCFIRGIPSEPDKNYAKNGFKETKKAVVSGKYDLVILDEINCIIELKLIELQDVIHLIKNKPLSVELVLTGRNAAKEIIEIADLVSEIMEVKHYFKKGVFARKGIEI